MGTRRLSVALTALLCSTTVLGLLSVGRTITVVDWLQVLMLIICVGLLFTPNDGHGESLGGTPHCTSKCESENRYFL